MRVVALVYMMSAQQALAADQVDVLDKANVRVLLKCCSLGRMCSSFFFLCPEVVVSTSWDVKLHEHVSSM